VTSNFRHTAILAAFSCAGKMPALRSLSPYSAILKRSAIRSPMRMKKPRYLVDNEVNYRATINNLLDERKQIAYAGWVRIGADPTGAEPRARTVASSPHPRSKNGLMLPHLPSLTPADCMETLCPPTAQPPKPGNILKTKG